MKQSGLSLHSQLADAMASMARGQAASDPRTRGADWRLATVATVNADGTVTTTDGIVARRMDTYRYAAAGDVIVVSVSGSGSWLAAGRLSPSTGTGWRTPSLVSPWVDYGGSYQVSRYRRDGADIVIEGVVKTSGSVSGSVDIFTLPTGYRPPRNLVFPAMTAADARQVNVYSDGRVTALGMPSGTVTYLGLACRFSTI